MRTVLLAMLSAILASPAVAAEARPNVLWITCEDMSPTLGCYGDRYAVTPNLDKFAAEGVRYTHAFSVAGVCAPSRSCLITGVFPTALGTHHMRCQGTLPRNITGFTAPLREAGYYCTNNVKEDYNFTKPAGTWDESSAKAHYRNRKPGQPFFAVFNITTTHEGQIRSDEATYKRNTAKLTDAERHDPAKAPLPPFYPDTPIVRRDWALHADLITAMDKRVAELLSELADDKLAADTIVFFYSDHGIGLPRGKRWLYDAGVRVPLLVRCPEKFAALALGKPGSVTDRLVSFVDFGATVQSLCGVKVPGHIQGVPFLGTQAGKPRQYVHGHRDRMDERIDFTRMVRSGRWKYIRNYMPHIAWSQPLTYMDEMPTMREWRRLAAQGKLQGSPSLFMAPTKPAEELYDTTADPHELRNLAVEREHKDILDAMRRELRRWMTETGDLGPLPEAEMRTREKGMTAYEMRLKADLFPQGRILDALDAAQLSKPDVARLLRELGDADAAVRHWAAVHLGVQGKGVREAEDGVRKALTDTSPTVRVSAAEALARLGKPGEALPVLLAALKDPNEWVRVHAVNVLDALGESARPALQEIRAAKDDKNQYVQRVVAHALAALER